MQSRISCFNGTLFRKNLSRFWPLWGLAPFVGALFPLALFLQQVREHTRIHPLEMTGVYYSAVSWVLPALTLCYAVLCAMTVWSYLYNARSVSLMHTLPHPAPGGVFHQLPLGHGHDAHPLRRHRCAVHPGEPVRPCL